MVGSIRKSCISYPLVSYHTSASSQLTVLCRQVAKHQFSFVLFFIPSMVPSFWVASICVGILIVT